jgi:glycosyltransferase involved in cell wall biosynthesis
VTKGTLEFLVPGDLHTFTGGYGYDRRIAAGLRALGWRVSIQTLDASFPEPTPAALDNAFKVFASLDEQALVLVDGLALGAMPDTVRPHSDRLRLVALVHHPLAAEAGLAPERVRRLVKSERQALQSVRHVIVTSDATKRELFHYGIPPERISVVQPGTDEAPLVSGYRGGLVRMLCVATVTHRKGHDVLIDALATLATRPWHLNCVGSITRSPETRERLRLKLQETGLSERVRFLGELDQACLAAIFRASDLFVLPSRFEGYGMAVAEALGYGLPVVASHTGAIPELLGAGAGLLVPPGDSRSLHAALARVLNEPSLLASLADRARLVRNSLGRWSDTSVRLSQVLHDVISEAARAIGAS